MVDKIRDAALTAEKGIDAIEHLSDTANDLPPSQEEIEMRKMEAQAKQVINKTLSVAVSIEKSLSNCDWGNNEITRKGDIAL